MAALPQINEKHYQLYKRLRIQGFIDISRDDRLVDFQLFMRLFRNNMNEIGYTDINYLKSHFGNSFINIKDMFDYDDETIRLFILRCNQELVYEFGNLTHEQIMKKWSEYLDY